MVEDQVAHNSTLDLRICDHITWFWRRLGTAFGHFLLSSHNFMVTTLGLCVKWPWFIPCPYSNATSTTKIVWCIWRSLDIRAIAICSLPSWEAHLGLINDSWRPIHPNDRYQCVPHKILLSMVMISFFPMRRWLFKVKNELSFSVFGIILLFWKFSNSNGLFFLPQSVYLFKIRFWKFGL